jgi:hypothetical protein
MDKQYEALQKVIAYLESVIRLDKPYDDSHIELAEELLETINFELNKEK